jgi:hypothetical protein
MNRAVTLPARISKPALARALGVSEGEIDEMVADGRLPAPLTRNATAPEIWAAPALRRHWNAKG